MTQYLIFRLKKPKNVWKQNRNIEKFENIKKMLILATHNLIANFSNSFLEGRYFFIWPFEQTFGVDALLSYLSVHYSAF